MVPLRRWTADLILVATSRAGSVEGSRWFPPVAFLRVVGSLRWGGKNWAVLVGHWRLLLAAGLETEVGMVIDMKTEVWNDSVVLA